MRGLFRRLREDLRWIWGAPEMGLQGFEFDEKSGKLLPRLIVCEEQHELEPLHVRNDPD
jgi:hypothetical protein